jgi:hypothetical protein
LEVADKRLERLLATFDMNLDTGVTVQHPPVESVRSRETKHKRPESDPLDYAAHVNPARQPIGASVDGHGASGRGADRAAAASPPDLFHKTVFDENGHSRAAGERHKAGPGVRVSFHVIFGECHAVPEKMLAQFRRVRTSGGAVEFDAGF